MSYIIIVVTVSFLLAYNGRCNQHSDYMATNGKHSHKFKQGTKQKHIITSLSLVCGNIDIRDYVHGIGDKIIARTMFVIMEVHLRNARCTAMASW